MTYFEKGDPVVYQPHPDAVPLDGVVVRQTEHFVFVQYEDGGGPKATYPNDLKRREP